MTSFRATDALLIRLFADVTFFHELIISSLPVSAYFQISNISVKITATEQDYPKVPERGGIAYGLFLN